MKPYVICHMCASVDGRTLLSRWRPENTVAAGLFERLHDELDGDAWLVGRVTGQEFAKGKTYPVSTGESISRQAWFARRDAKAYAVVLDANGKIVLGPLGHRRRSNRRGSFREGFGRAFGRPAQRGRVLFLRR
jgi:hypothetical protein